MRRLLILFGFLAGISPAMACDTYTSADKEPGARLIVASGDFDAGFTLKENGKDRHFAFADAGTGSGMIVGVPDDGADDAAQIKTPKGEFWFGPEKFVEYCN